jgi:hypothetical protein
MLAPGEGDERQREEVHDGTGDVRAPVVLDVGGLPMPGWTTTPPADASRLSGDSTVARCADGISPFRNACRQRRGEADGCGFDANRMLWRIAPPPWKS